MLLLLYIADIIEDDYDSEFRYKGKPIPSSQGLDSNGNVIYVGRSFGKMKIKVYPTSIYYAGCVSTEFPMILLGFGGLTEMQIEEGIQILKKAWFI